MATLASGAFVGRQREMGELKAALEQALSGHGQLVMLAGEPGIGKTHTARELAAFASPRGARVLWGRCYEEPGMPPYWPWAQTIRTCVLGWEAEALWAAMGAGASDIAQVVAEVKELLPDLSSPPPLDDPAQARFRLFDSITSFLKRASQIQPLLLVLDDLHWADPSSLRLLEFIAQELAGARVLLLGTYRDVEVSRGHPLFRTLGELARQRHYRRVFLQGLGLDEVGQVMAGMGNTNPPLELVSLVYQHTEGNPLFVGEVVRLLAQEGLLAPERLEDLKNWDFRLPEGVREVIGRRLDRLSGECNQVLITAAVIGREFSLGLLQALMEDSSAGSWEVATEEQLLGILEEALGARIIGEAPGVSSRYQFSHTLIQETLVGELSTTRKVRLHARIAQALEQLYGPQAEAHAAELSRHFAEAEVVLGTEKLVKYSLLAGEKALTSYAWEEALQHFQRGLAAKAASSEGTGPARDGEEAALLFGLGRAQLGALDRLQQQQAVDILGRAFHYYETQGDVSRAVAIAQYTLPIDAMGRTEASQYIPRALKLTPSDSPVAGRLLAAYGYELGRLENDYQGAQETFARALAIAQREQDPSLEIRILSASANVDNFQMRLRDTLEKARQAIGLAQALDDPQSAWSAHLDTTRALIALGEADGARHHASVSLELAEKLRDRFRLATAFRVNLALHRQLGDWEQARDLADRGLAVVPQETQLLWDRAVLEYELGEYHRGEVYLERFLEPIPLRPLRPGGLVGSTAAVIPLIARITGALDRLDVSARCAEILLSSPLTNPFFANLARAGLGLMAVLHHDAASCAEHYANLDTVRGILIYFCISGDRLLGLLSHTMGNLDQASQHFENALGFCRKAGYRPELAWTCCDYADTLLARHQPGDRQRAMSLLDECLRITRELGMRPLAERAATLQQQNQPRNLIAGYPDALSQREVEVLRLMALGKSNRDIADELVISLRTVVHHVTSILNKTGAANRTEAAAYAARHGLISWSR